MITYKKNDEVTLVITDMGNDGEGIGKADGYTVFVKDAVIGDHIRAKIIKAKKSYGKFWNPPPSAGRPNVPSPDSAAAASYRH